MPTTDCKNGPTPHAKESPTIAPTANMAQRTSRETGKFRKMDEMTIEKYHHFVENNVIPILEPIDQIASQEKLVEEATLFETFCQTLHQELACWSQLQEDQKALENVETAITPYHRFSLTFLRRKISRMNWEPN